MSKSLFSEFDPVSSKAWKQKIQVDLKGADYNETLVWSTHEGIDVKPFYHADEFDALNTTSSSKATSWKINQTIDVDNEKDANSKALDALKRGAEHITFIVKNEAVNIDTLLNGIDLAQTNVRFKTDFISSDFVIQYSREGVTFDTDIIGHLARTGNWYSNLNDDHIHFENIVKNTAHFSIDSSLFQNAGATCVQQLAYALGHANEYLNHLDTVLDKGKKETLQVTFNLAIGTNYFFEIAKLRALRQLWQSLAPEYGVNPECQIIATPSKRNKTIYDYNVNMLRTTTECMSAILGGANIISNLAYDALYQKDNEFGSRVSRNQLLVLKRESYFDKVNNPSDGAYYIEYLTTQLSEKALALFKDIEANGGFLKQLKASTIQRKVKESAQKEQAEFDAGKLVLLGTNKHPNPADQMRANLEISPFLKVEKRKTLIEPIIEKRLAEALELERLEQES